MKKLSTPLVFGFLGLATFASLVGTVSGTLAWYAYNSRTTISYSGTSIENAVQLQIGLVCDAPMAYDASDQDNVEFWNLMGERNNPGTPRDLVTKGGKYYYFAPLGQGISSQVVNAYLKAHNYATNVLEPITSGYYDPDKLYGLSLKNAPSIDYPETNVSAAPKNYLKLSFAFRVTKSKTGEGDFVANQRVWLTDAKSAASSVNPDAQVFKAMRVFFDRDTPASAEDLSEHDYKTDFIVNPNAASSGATRVGGVLDLSGDGYYDFDANGEVIYGEWDKTALLNPATKLSQDGFDEQENPIIDLNGNGQEASASSFCARHRSGVRYFTHESLHNENGVPVRTAKYESLSAVKPVRGSTGTLSNPIVDDEEKDVSVCVTANSPDNQKELRIGCVDAYIWLEGWDYAVVDEEQQHSFDLGLTFEVNKASS